jgi:hypothetical protein
MAVQKTKLFQQGTEEEGAGRQAAGDGGGQGDAPKFYPAAGNGMHGTPYASIGRAAVPGRQAFRRAEPALRGFQALRVGRRPMRNCLEKFHGVKSQNRTYVR